MKHENKANRTDVLKMLLEVIETTTREPAEELIAMGVALQKIGMALRGQSLVDARAIVKSARLLVLGEDSK